MKISVIIPIYNTDKYLALCLDSLLAQSFKDWECLLINDGSKDNSSEICDTYVKKDSRFKVFHTENAGVSSARNLGIDNSKGTYLAFIDSDDTVDPDYLKALYNGASNGKSELTVCGMKIIHSTHTIIHKPHLNSFSICNGNSDKFLELNKLYLLYGPYVKLYSINIIKSNNIRFPINIDFGEDLMFNYTYLEYVTHISVCENSNYNYFIRKGSLATKPRQDRHETELEQWEILYKFHLKKDLLSNNTKKYLFDRLYGIVYDSIIEIYNTKTISLFQRFYRIRTIIKLSHINKFNVTDTQNSLLRRSILKGQYAMVFIILELKK